MFCLILVNVSFKLSNLSFLNVQPGSIGGSMGSLGELQREIEESGEDIFEPLKSNLIVVWCGYNQNLYLLTSSSSSFHLSSGKFLFAL